MRSATAASAGLLRELGDVALPAAVRRTSLYRNMVEGTLRFLIEAVDHILTGLEDASGRVADAVNTPPLDVAGLRKEWNEIQKRVRRIPPSRLPTAERLWAGWRDLRAEAAAQKRSVFQLSSLMAVSALGSLPDGARWLSRSAATAAKSTGAMFASPLLDHYRDTLGEIHREGVVRYWSRQFGPYLRAAAAQFSPGRRSLTERLLDRGAARCGGLADSPAGLRDDPGLCHIWYSFTGSGMDGRNAEPCGRQGTGGPAGRYACPLCLAQCESSVWPEKERRS